MTAEFVERRLDAVPDTLDFRDALYSPSLVRVRAVSDLDAYRARRIPVLNQGTEGACTGFGLATVANFLLRVRGEDPKAEEVSAWMLYTMAKRYDEWPGEDYSGSSARGAMKGWHKHGICALRLWRDSGGGRTASTEHAADALKRPLGAYYRVNHRDLVSMHAAISEVGVLFATARVHAGWSEIGTGQDTIPFSPILTGGHAFAIVGYDREGFWIQNSWGESWGVGGIARLAYHDWLANGTDVWVAALGAPLDLAAAGAPAVMRSAAPLAYEAYIYSALRPHIVTAKNDGRLDDKGTYGLTEQGLKAIVADQMPKRMDGWNRRRVLLYAHGGLVAESGAVQVVASNRQAALDAEVYPISIIWRSDALTTIGNVLREALGRRKDEGPLGRALDFMLDRVDDTLEPIARVLGGKTLWDEMKENAVGASTRVDGAARLTTALIAEQVRRGAVDEVHLAGHSAGAILMAWVARDLASAGIPIASISLWAPACTFELFDSHYRPLIENDSVRAFDLYTLDDATERDDDCANIYNKSLLYLISAALEERSRIYSRTGTHLLGLARDVQTLIPRDFWNAERRWIRAPGPFSGARRHGDFDNDGLTLASMLDRISGDTIRSPRPVRLSTRPAARAALRNRLDSAMATR